MSSENEWDVMPKATASAEALVRWLAAEDVPRAERGLASEVRSSAMLAAADSLRATLPAPILAKVEALAGSMAAQVGRVDPAGAAEVTGVTASEGEGSGVSLTALAAAARHQFPEQEKGDLLNAAARLERLPYCALQDACDELRARACLDVATPVEIAIWELAGELLFEKFVALLTPEQRARYEQLFPGAVAGAAPARG